MKRVVITGIGMVTPLGLNTQETWDAQLAGKSGISRITQFDPTGFPVQIAGQINPDFWANPKNYLPNLVVPERNVSLHKDLRRMHRVTQIAVKAALEALTQSGLVIDDSNRKQVGCYIGSGGGGANEYIDAVRTLDTRGPNRVDPLLSVRLMPNATPGALAKIFGAKGPALAVSAACATGNEALRLAKQEIERGRCTAMIAGGAEAALDTVVIASFGNLGALTKHFNDRPEKASRPFDRDRSGFVWADGAVVMILEEEVSARTRGAKILGYFLGAYATDDAFHETRPEDGAFGSQDAMRGALEEAQVRPEDIGLISLHGTSTPENDVKETLAINAVFGRNAEIIPADPTKSRVGHMIGASGPFSMATSLLELNSGLVLPALNLDNQDPDCNLYLRDEVGLLIEARCGIINNAGFGGHNSSLVIQAAPWN